MLHSLLRLRQACDHHQLGQSTGFVSLQKHTLSMREMTSELKEEARLQGEEAQRLMFFAINATGSLRMIRGEWAEAMQLYRQVLGLKCAIDEGDDERWRREIEEERGRGGKRVIQMDVSQEMHALHNLADAARRAFAVSLPKPPTSSSSEPGDAVVPSSPPPESREVSTTPAVLALVQSRVAFLYERVALLKAKSLDRHNSVFFAHQQKWRAAHDESEAQHAAFSASSRLSSWYSDTIDLVHSLPSSDLQDLLLRRVQAELADAQSGYSRKRQSEAAASIADSFRDLFGLRVVISRHFEELKVARARILGKLQRMVDIQPPTAEAIHLSVNCQRCKQLKGPVCDHCKCEVLVRQWERSLYRFVKEMGQGWVPGATRIDEANILEPTTRQQQRNLTGSTAADDDAEAETLSKLDHDVEIALKAIHSFTQQHKRELARSAEDEGRVEGILEGGKRQLEVLAVEKKECAVTRSFVVAHQHQLYAFDETNMACTRIQLQQRSPDKREEAKDADVRGRRQREAEAEKRNALLGVVYEYEIPGLLAQYERDRLAASSQLREALSKMQFLLTQITDEEGEGKEGGDRHPCPICLERDLRTEEEVVVLPACGHKYCTYCILTLLEHVQQHGGQWITCGVCRRRQRKTEMRYVSNTRQQRTDLDGRAEQVGGVGSQVILQKTSASSSSSSSSTTIFSLPPPTAVAVKGGWSTKVNEVVRLVLSILSSSPQAKLLVFSEWKDMLSLLSKAFSVNAVPSLLLVSRPTFGSTLHRFHHDPSCRVLLLPMKGSNEGLNLTSASHVLFIEPSLSRAREEQGVGRVWRMGQRQACHVHRLVIQHSVEERIHGRNERGGGKANRVRRHKRAEDEVAEEDFIDLLRGEEEVKEGREGTEERKEGKTGREVQMVNDNDDEKAERGTGLSDAEYWQATVRLPADHGGQACTRLEALGRLQRTAYYQRREADSPRAEGGARSGKEERKEEPVSTLGRLIVHHGRSVYEDIARQLDALSAIR